jgi:hypothetical protein
VILTFCFVVVNITFEAAMLRLQCFKQPRLMSNDILEVHESHLVAIASNISLVTGITYSYNSHFHSQDCPKPSHKAQEHSQEQKA